MRLRDIYATPWHSIPFFVLISPVEVGISISGAHEQILVRRVALPMRGHQTLLPKLAAAEWRGASEDATKFLTDRSHFQILKNAT